MSRDNHPFLQFYEASVKRRYEYFIVMNQGDIIMELFHLLEFCIFMILDCENLISIFSFD